VDRSLRVEPNVVGGEKELRSPACIWRVDASVPPPAGFACFFLLRPSLRIVFSLVGLVGVERGSLRFPGGGLASIYLDGTPQKRIVEKLGIGASRGSQLKRLIQELCADIDIRINMQLGGQHKHPAQYTYIHTHMTITNSTLLYAGSKTVEIDGTRSVQIALLPALPLSLS
jgi:hypothetical protein